MASPRSRRVLKDLKIKDDNNVRTTEPAIPQSKAPFPMNPHMLQLFGTPHKRTDPQNRRYLDLPEDSNYQKDRQNTGKTKEY